MTHHDAMTALDRDDPAGARRATGYLLLPAFAEPHAHLDKAFLAERVPNPTGDLMGAILAMERARAIDHRSTTRSSAPSGRRG